MTNINLVSLISKLIRDYEKVYGMTSFEAKKKDQTFIYVYADENLLEQLNFSRKNVIGKTILDVVSETDLANNLTSIFEKAWNGKEIIDYKVFPFNKEIMIVYTLKPVLKNGKTDRLEGHCALLETKDFKKWLHLINNRS